MTHIYLFRTFIVAIKPTKIFYRNLGKVAGPIKEVTNNVYYYYYYFSGERKNEIYCVISGTVFMVQVHVSHISSSQHIPEFVIRHT